MGSTTVFSRRHLPDGPKPRDAAPMGQQSATRGPARQRRGLGVPPDGSRSRLLVRMRTEVPNRCSQRALEAIAPRSRVTDNAKVFRLVMTGAVCVRW